MTMNNTKKVKLLSSHNVSGIQYEGPEKKVQSGHLGQVYFPFGQVTFHSHFPNQKVIA